MELIIKVVSSPSNNWCKGTHYKWLRTGTFVWIGVFSFSDSIVSFGSYSCRMVNSWIQNYTVKY